MLGILRSLIQSRNNVGKAHRCQEEHRYVTNSLGKLQEQLKVLLGASARRFIINHSFLVLVQPGSTII